MRVATALIVSSTLLAGCEVNLNSEGLSARDVKTFKIERPAGLGAEYL